MDRLLEFRGTPTPKTGKQKHTNEQLAFSHMSSDLKVHPGTDTKKQWFPQQPNRWQARNGSNLLRKCCSYTEFNLTGRWLLCPVCCLLQSTPVQSPNSYIWRSSSYSSSPFKTSKGLELLWDSFSAWNSVPISAAQSSTIRRATPRWSSSLFFSSISI